MIVMVKDKKRQKVVIGEITEALDELGRPYKVHDGWIETDIDIIITPIEEEDNEHR